MAEVGDSGAMSTRRRAVGFVVVALGTLLGPLDTMVNIAFPFITDAFRQPVAMIQWIVICYVLVYSSLMLVCGRLGDLFGHRRVYGAGLGVIALAYLLCAAAPSYPWLLAFRALQGVGAALVLSCGAALVTSLFAENRRGRALGAYTMLFGLGGILGPIVGGLAIDAWDWRAVFWIRAPLALIALALIGLLPRSAPGAAGGRLDVAGAALLIVGLAAALMALNRLQGAAWTPVIALAAVAVAAFALFVRHQARFPEPILRLAIFRDAAFAMLNAASTVVHGVAFAVLLLAPYFLVRIGGLDAAWAGVILATAPLGFSLGSAASPRLVAALGARQSCLLGAVVVAGGLWWTGGWSQAAGPFALSAPLIVMGLGYGLFQAAYTDYVVALLPKAERGVAGSLTMLTRTIGVVAGATGLTMIHTALDSAARAQGLGPDAAFIASFQTTFQLAAAILVGFLALTLLRPRTWFR